MTDDVVIEEIVIETTERGGRGRDGVTGDYVVVEQTNDSGNAPRVRPVRTGAAYGILTTYRMTVSFTTTGTSMAIEVEGVNTPGDPALLKHVNSDVDFDPRSLIPGDVLEFTGRPINPEDPAEGLLNWELIGPGVGLADDTDFAAEVSDRVALTPSRIPALRQGVAANVLRTDFQSDYELLTASRPGRAKMLDPSRILIKMRPWDADYRDGYVRDDTDFTMFEVRNLAGIYHQGLSYPQCWVMMSAWTCFEGVLVPHINYVWDRLIGSSTTNNGQVPSAFDPIGFFGRSDQSVASIVALAASGPLHGHFDQLTFSLNVTGGRKDGAVIPDGADIQATFKPGEVINFTQLDFNGNRAMYGPAYPGGDPKPVIVTSTDVLRFGGGQQCYANAIHQFEPSPGGGVDNGVVVGYALNNCFRYPNRMQARNKAGDLVTPTCSNPAHISGQTAIVGMKDSAIINFPEAVRVTGWRTGPTAGHCFENEMPATAQPARRNGVEIPYDHPGFVIDDAAGPKYRQPIWVGSADFTAETGNQMNYACYYRGVRANGA